MSDWHSLSAQDALEKLGTLELGLGKEQAAKRLEKYGRNVIEEKKKISIVALLAEQFKSPLVLVLIFAGLAAFFFEKPTDAYLILAIVMLNGLFGFVQNYNAEKSIEALRKIGAPKATVIRSGALLEISAEEVVPGDILYLQEGSKVAADARVIESWELCADESILTGESVPVRKSTGPVHENALIPERRCMVFMSTLVTAGKGKAVVVATGKGTEVGKIASELGQIKEEETLFQLELDQLGKRIGAWVLALVALIAITMIFFHKAEYIDVFVTAVSVSVAAIPEGLPAVVTISLAIATRKMLRKKSLVRKLSVIESLGSVDVICTDKTGTLTENSMTVQQIWFDGKNYSVTGTGRSVSGEFLQGARKVGPDELREVLLCGLACNDAVLEKANGQERFIGDPTEIALMVSALKAGLSLRDMNRTRVISFTSERKRMTVVMQDGKAQVAYSKGAPEIIVRSCSRILRGKKAVPFTEAMKREVLTENHRMSSGALRTLAFARRHLEGKDDPEKGMTFLGLQGMIDPPRQEVAGALTICKAAGIRVVMLTGDNKATAEAIAKSIGFGGKSIDAGELLDMGESEFEKAVFSHDVFARVSPEQKLRVLEVLKKNGHRVAMTGDGVNDAPALKKADVGISMGIRGSDVAKESSDIVLLDDNFATIIDAVAEGRTVFDNIRKFVLYLLASNIAEVMIIFLASLAGKLPILPVQLLWVNLLTDGLPALALGADPPKPHVMNELPRRPEDGIINRTGQSIILLLGAILTVIVLALFFAYAQDSLAKAQTIVFTSLVLYELVRVIVVRQLDGLKFFSNKWVPISLLFSFALQLAVIYSPLANLFGVVPLAINDWIVIALGGILAYLASTLGAGAVLSGTGQKSAA